jgi:hypothetical protein
MAAALDPPKARKHRGEPRRGFYRRSPSKPRKHRDQLFRALLLEQSGSFVGSQADLCRHRFALCAKK